MAASASACSASKSAAQQQGARARGSGRRPISQRLVLFNCSTLSGQAAGSHRNRTAHLQPPTGCVVAVVIPSIGQRVAARGAGACALLRHSLELGVQQLLQEHNNA